MKRITIKTLGAFAALFALLVAGTAIAADGDVQALAKRLAELRSEVESLSSQVENKKADINAKLRSVRSQKADLEMQIQREEVRLEQLRQAVQKHQDRIAAQNETRADLAPAAKKAIGEVRHTVAQSLPFKRSERLAELDKLEEQLDDELISPQKATARLWQFLEDELRLARENGLYRQIVEVDGDEVLADVARVGMIAIYFKTEDGRVGMAEKSAEGWKWTKVSGEENTKRVRNLFDSFKKNIRVGYFEIPNALPAQAEQVGGAQ